MFASVKHCLGVRPRQHQTSTHDTSTRHATACPAAADSSPRVVVRFHSRQGPFWWTSALQRRLRPNPSMGNAQDGPGTDTAATASAAEGTPPSQSATTQALSPSITMSEPALTGLPTPLLAAASSGSVTASPSMPDPRAARTGQEGAEQSTEASPGSASAAVNRPETAASNPEPTASLPVTPTPQLPPGHLAQAQHQQIYTLHGRPLSAEEAAAVQRLTDLGETPFCFVRLCVLHSVCTLNQPLHNMPSTSAKSRIQRALNTLLGLPRVVTKPLFCPSAFLGCFQVTSYLLHCNKCIRA